MSTTEPEPTEDQLRAAYEAEMKQVRVEHVLLEHVVMLVNLGMRRTGLAPGTETERDPGQVRLAIEAIRTSLPLLEQSAPQQMAPIREALSQLQLAFVRIGGPPGEAAPVTAAGGPAQGTSPEGGFPPHTPGPPATTPGPQAPGTPPPGPEPGESGPARRSGRLWIPGD
ncbi:MAG: hypothetical protein ACR2LV_11275 [Solirubrobacteraceae bacterium]